MAACIICGGKGFTLYDGQCDECDGTGENGLSSDVIAFDDDMEDLHSDTYLMSASTEVFQ